MNIDLVYKSFPNESDCIKHLEKVIWNNKPTCPYCKSKSQTSIPKELRYHCNSCNISYSVTVGTILHNTKIDLRKWFLAIFLVREKKGLSARQFAINVGVTKDTGCSMLVRIRRGFLDNAKFLDSIVIES